MCRLTDHIHGGASAPPQLTTDATSFVPVLHFLPELSCWSRCRAVDVSGWVSVSPAAPGAVQAESGSKGWKLKAGRLGEAGPAEGKSLGVRQA